MLSHLSMEDARTFYSQRYNTHKQILSLFQQRQPDEYLKLALGIKDPSGNYSAAEHETPMGAKILANNQATSVFALADDLYNCINAQDIPDIIYKSGLRFLKISIGSEMAMMLRPDRFWVDNLKTMWAHLLIKHGDNYENAEAELKLYWDSERGGEMDYKIWRETYPLLDVSLTRLYDLGIAEARKHSVPVDNLHKYLWADVLASMLFEYRKMKTRTTKRRSRPPMSRNR